MPPEPARSLISSIQDLFAKELTKLQLCLRQGLPIREYQVRDVTHQALAVSLRVLETFTAEFEQYYIGHSVKQCLALIQDRHDTAWKNLPENERLQRMMAAIGFLASDMGLPDDAEVLFDTLVLLDPDNVYPLLGLAYVKLSRGAAHQALELIRHKVLDKSPGNDLGLAFLSMAHAELNQNGEALAAASAVITANRDESAVDLALEVQRSLA